HRLVPHAKGLELTHQVTVDLKEVTRERLALEQVRHLRLDALVTTGDRGDRSGRGDRDEQRVAKAHLLDLRAQPFPVEIGGRLNTPGVELELTARSTRLGETRVRAVDPCELDGLRERVEVDDLADLLGDLARF